MSSQNAHFEYSTKISTGFIRLIHVQPPRRDSRSTPLEVQLTEHQLDGANFDALSYVWGDCHDKTRILCNNAVFHIGRNLYEALVERRRRNIRRALWADAICINQEDSIEKTKQVRQMSKIYQSAIRTIIWLGPSLPDDDVGLLLAESIYDTCKTNYPTPGTDRNTNDFYTVSDMIPNIFEGLNINNTWQSLFKILSHPWFERVWVIQELVLSSTPCCWRGSKSVKAHTLLWTAYQVNRRQNLQTAFARFHHFLNVPALGITHFYFNVNASLCNRYHDVRLWINIHNSLGMKATDLRDRFFSISSISTNLPTDFVDYSRSLEQVTVQVMLMWLLDRGSRPTTDALDFLADSSSTNVHSKATPVPSWTFDFFSQQPRAVHLRLSYSTAALRRRRTSFPNIEVKLIIESENGEVNDSVQPVFPFRYYKIRALQLSGIIFDKIKVIMPITDLIKNDIQNEHRASENLNLAFKGAQDISIRIIKFINQARILAEPELVNGDMMSPKGLDSFWRTLIYNRTQFVTDEEKEPDEIVGVSFGYWYLMLKLFASNMWSENPGLFISYTTILRPLAYPFKNTFDQIYSSRRFFVSEHGRIGWAPLSSNVGNELAVLKGNRVPHIIRTTDNCQAEYVGGCYVHGCMDGEFPHTPSAWSTLNFI